MGIALTRFREKLEAATTRTSPGGTTIEGGELVEALKVLVPTNKNDVTRRDLDAAQRLLGSDRFVRSTSMLNLAMAEMVIDDAYRSLDSRERITVKVGARDFIVGKRYTLPADLPDAPRGWGWALHGAAPTKPGHIIASLIRDRG